MLNSINRFAYSSNISFKGGPKIDKTSNLTSALTQNAISEMKKRGELEMPEYGHFRAIMHLFDIPNSKNEAVFTIQHNLTAPKDQRSLTIGARGLGHNQETYNVIKTGTKKEILKALDDLDLNSAIATIEKLSKNLD